MSARLQTLTNKCVCDMISTCGQGQAQDLPLQGWRCCTSVGATLVVAHQVARFENTAHRQLHTFGVRKQ
jgi:hypothetical protein